MNEKMTNEYLYRNFCKIEDEIKSEIGHWIRNNIKQLYYVKIVIDTNKMKITLNRLMTDDEISLFETIFGMSLTMKEFIQRENISEKCYELGSNTYAIHTFRGIF